MWRVNHSQLESILILLEGDFAMPRLKMIFVVLLSLVAWDSKLIQAQSAGTWVDVGLGRAGAGGTASGQFQHVDSSSRVGPFGSVAHGVAVGAGPNGMSISHSFGVHQAGGQGMAKHFSMSIGPAGSHVSHSNVNSLGGNSRVLAGGNTQVGLPGLAVPSGGSFATGFGRHTVANSSSQSFPGISSLRPPLANRELRPFGAPIRPPFAAPIRPRW